MGEKPKIVNRPTSDAASEVERVLLANVYAFVLERHSRREPTDSGSETLALPTTERRPQDGSVNCERQGTAAS